MVDLIPVDRDPMHVVETADKDYSDSCVERSNIGNLFSKAPYQVSSKQTYGAFTEQKRRSWELWLQLIWLLFFVFHKINNYNYF